MLNLHDTAACRRAAFSIFGGGRRKPHTKGMWIAERTMFGAMMVHDARFHLNGEEIPRLARILHGFGYGYSGVTDKFGEGDSL